MINIGTIYKITNPKGKVYIGQTIKFENRMSTYAGGRCKNQKKLYGSIQKYGWENHLVEVVCSGPFTLEGLNQLEIHYIRIHNSFKRGLNMTEGGRGQKGYKPTKQTLVKLAAANKGRKQSLEHIAKRIATKTARGTTGKGVGRSPEIVAKIAAANRGRKQSQETKDRISAASLGRPSPLKGKPKSEETKARMSAGQKGRKHSPEDKAKKHVPISQYTKEGVWIKDWPSLKEASEALGVNASGISDCLAGRRRTAGGFIWKYSEE